MIYCLFFFCSEDDGMNFAQLELRSKVIELLDDPELDKSKMTIKKASKPFFILEMCVL